MDIIESCEVPECIIPITTPNGEEMLCGERCVILELKMLWSLGIRTFCSCCGHGNDEKAYIRVDKRLSYVMDALGYEQYEPHKCIFHNKSSISYRAKLIEVTRENGIEVEKHDFNEVRQKLKNQAKIASILRGRVYDGEKS